MRLNELAFRYFILIFCLLIFTASEMRAQTTAFNFQGRLNDGGSAANSNYDFRFRLFDALSGGNQVGGTLERINLQVINGVFSTTLDFGAAFGAGNRFLEISVRPTASPMPTSFSAQDSKSSPCRLRRRRRRRRIRSMQRTRKPPSARRPLTTRSRSAERRLPNSHGSMPSTSAICKLPAISRRAETYASRILPAAL